MSRPDNPKLAATVVISAPQINLAFRVAAQVGAVRVDSSARADVNCAWVAGGLKDPLLATTVVISAPEINHSSWLAAQKVLTSVGPTSHKDVVDVGANVGELAEGPYLTTAVIIMRVQIHVSVGAAAQVLV